MGKYTEAKAEANARYDAKTYNLVGIRLRIEDDADIIADIEAAQQNGMTLREWLRSIYDNQG